MSVKIAILSPATVPWIALFLDGVREYADSHGEWHIFGSPPSLSSAGESALTIRSLKGWSGDGIIISSNDIDELLYARRLGIPVLNLSGGLPSSHGIPRIMTDHYKTGRIVAEHLIERGLTNLAFFGWEKEWYSQQRYRGFQERAEESGASCQALLRPAGEDSSLNWTRRIAVLTKWLASLPLPCGVFAVQDYRAQLLMEACHELNLRIPNDIAVVGMDNDEIICSHSVPELSSISRNAFRLGYEAASVLHCLMNGETIPSQEILIDPGEVVVRASSDMLYCDDALIREAIEFMRRHLRDSFNITAIADHLEISKRKLELRFSKAVNSSPWQYLTRLRISHAQVLMKLNPEKKVEAIATECGFTTPPTFYASFRRITGETPAAYRARHSDGAFSGNRSRK